GAQGTATPRGTAAHGSQREGARHPRLSGRGLSHAPAGYSLLRRGGTRAVVLDAFAAAVDAILAAGTTLHAWAATTRQARPLRGRDTAYATVLADIPVVVRHSRHGGLLAPITQDLFLAPTRAPHELDVSLRL